MKDIKLFRKQDLAVTVVVLLLALALLIPSFLKKDTLKASIVVDGKITKEIDLSSVSQDYVFSPKSGTEIEVGKGKIRFSSACCKDGLCVNSGWLTKNGQTAACLPERVVIYLEGSDSEPDILTY